MGPKLGPLNAVWLGLFVGTLALRTGSVPGTGAGFLEPFLHTGMPHQALIQGEGLGPESLM